MAKVSATHSTLDLKDIIVEAREQEGEEEKGAEGAEILAEKIVAVMAKRVEPTIATTKKTDEGMDVLNKKACTREVTIDNVCKIDYIRKTMAIVMAELHAAIETDEGLRANNRPREVSCILLFLLPFISYKGIVLFLCKDSQIS